MIRWPWTSLQALNLDWILAKMKELIEKVDAFAEHVTASATTGAAGTNASVTVTGDLDTGLDFAFTIPRGNKGDTGPAGADGQDGDSFKIMGLVATTADLPHGASVGDCYAVGTNASNTCYVWNGGQWQDIGPYNALSTTTKSMVVDNPNPHVIKNVVQANGNQLSVYLDLEIGYPALDEQYSIAHFSWDADIPYDNAWTAWDGLLIPVVYKTRYSQDYEGMTAAVVSVSSSGFMIKPAPGVTFNPVKDYVIHFTIMK